MQVVHLGSSEENHCEGDTRPSVVPRGRRGQDKVSPVWHTVELSLIAGVRSVFEGSNIAYPTRRVTHEDNGDSKMGS
jgi:hypothetical protein